ncbi:hypothetical protein PMZ80_003048 [Knufia obscura]|uniref:EKC/KEOPS complex subunit CGI121 n=2 Tax=Knufia TaxID=430999 RepID=A0AAN8ECJ5_9EURO|nr:hypothetical protein PMZ80_003048 [Knufia obscura]KAK5952364.1 hypothetical protein OHC33_006407 [Knufia fluminis]
MVEKLHLSHLPPELAVYVASYTNVKNAAYLRQQLLAGNQTFNYAFIDASTILSRGHLLTACFRACNDYIHDRLKSNNVQSEIVFCLSSNNNIGDAFRRFGISDDSKDIVVVKVGDSAVEEGNQNMTKSGIEAHLNGSVEGTNVDFSDAWLRDVCALDKVRKNYKIARPQPAKGLKAVNGDMHGTKDERSEVEVQVLGLMALRGAT